MQTFSFIYFLQFILNEAVHLAHSGPKPYEDTLCVFFLTNQSALHSIASISYVTPLFTVYHM